CPLVHAQGLGKFVQFLCCLDCTEKFGFRLGHDDTKDLTTVTVDIYRKHTDVAFVKQASDRPLERQASELAQDIERTQYRMAGKRYFLRGSEDPDFCDGRQFGRWKNEDRLREVHFPGNLL